MDSVTGTCAYLEACPGWICLLTFDNVVINPKPQLNVIVGPNGTGKSSIVCALCLGLGGSTSILGRAKDVKDFVKHGSQTGFVEITLCDDRARRNPVIRRTMSADNNSSRWTINHDQVNEKDVKKVVESLGIQLGNRCMFLPQDKVVEFARMNKQELLIETEKTVGPKELYRHHEELKNLKSGQSKSHDIVRRKNKELEDLVRKNRLLERDVEKYNNRQNIIKDIKHLSYKKYWVKYQESRNKYDQKKNERKQAVVELRSMKDCYQLIKDRFTTLDAAVDLCKRSEREAMHEGHKMEKTLREKKDSMRELDDTMDQPKQELENAKRQEVDRKSKIETLRREIDGFKSDLEELESKDSVNSKVVELNARIKGIMEDIALLSDRQRVLMTEKQDKENFVRQCDKELREMNSIWTQRLQKLDQRKEYSTARVIHWLQENQHKFKQPIFEPVCMSLNIRNPRFARQAESFFSGRDFYSFVAQNEDDRERFLREVYDNMRLKVNIVRAPDRPLSAYTPAIPFQVLKNYGFETMLLDVVEAPEPVLCYFSHHLGIHNVPIARNLRPDEVQRITTGLSQLQSFYTATMRYSVKKSKYRNATSTRSAELFQPWFLVASVDSQKKEVLEKGVQEAQVALSDYEHKYQKLVEKDQQLRREDALLRDQKQKLRRVMENRKSHQSNIKSREKRLEQALAMTFNLQEAEEKCVKAVDQIQREKLECMGLLKKLVQENILCTDKIALAYLTVHTADARSNYFMSQFHQAKSAYDDAVQKVKELESLENDSKAIAGQLLAVAREKTGARNPEDNPDLLSSFGLFPDQLDAIDEKLHDLRAQAEMCAGTDMHVYDEFKTREHAIMKLRAELIAMAADLGDSDERIKTLKLKWLEPLLELIEKVNARFSSYFSLHTHLNCAGLVRLEPNPEENPDFSDFEKYGVQIKVKFRDQEEMQELNAQRQSGGERSVATVLYLMALQGNTSCPFRVVDEINQGMDPINERHVFNLIVKSAAQGAQYFLLTPKVLQNLDYSDDVTIHIVNNGQEIMQCDEWDLGKFLS